MRTALGTLLVMIGLAMAVLWLPERDSEQQLAVVTEIATQGVAPVSTPATAQDARASRTFSPQTPLMQTTGEPKAVERRTSPVANAPATTATVPAIVPPAPAQATRPAVPPFRTEVAPASGVVVTSATPPGSAAQRLAAARPMDEGARVELARNIQRELKRVGCYQGDVDGDWGAGSKRAMSAFTERVNATLPVEDPDYILLTLVQGHAGQACGRGCPAGQSANESGRCLPNAVIASARKATDSERKIPPRREIARNETVASAGEHPTTTPNGVLRPSQPDGGWSASVRTDTTATGVATAAAGAAALAGRMAIGGPRTSPQQELVPPAPALPARPLPDPADALGNERTGVDKNGDGSNALRRDGSQPRPRTAGANAAPTPKPVVVYRAPRQQAPQPSFFFSPPTQPRVQQAQRAWMNGFFNR